MALKPGIREIKSRKRELREFMDKNKLKPEDISSMLTEKDSLKSFSTRTVQSWLSPAEAASSRTPPENLVGILTNKLPEYLQRQAKAG